MFNRAYVYNLNVGQRTLQKLELCHENFKENIFCSNGLVGLAEALHDALPHYYSCDSVKVFNHAPPLYASLWVNSPLTEPQKEIFEQAFPKQLKLQWADERETPEYRAMVEYFRSLPKEK